MNVALRRIHRVVFLALGATLPALVVLALTDRPVRPANDLSALGENLSFPLARAAGGRVFEGADGVTIAATPGGTFELRATSSLREPDVLAYASRDGGMGAKLPADARLLGSVIPGRRLVLALEREERDVVLYSLGHQKALSRTRLREDER